MLLLGLKRGSPQAYKRAAQPATVDIVYRLCFFTERHYSYYEHLIPDGIRFVHNPSAYKATHSVIWSHVNIVSHDEKSHNNTVRLLLLLFHLLRIITVGPRMRVVWITAHTLFMFILFSVMLLVDSSCMCILFRLQLTSQCDAENAAQ